MDQTTRWLRVSYWTGAIVDGTAAAVMFAQAAFAMRSTFNDYLPDPPYRYAMGLAAALMLGWTILLLWADRRPVERRAVLLITNVVILGLMASEIGAAAAGFLPLSSLIPILGLQVALLALFTTSYVRSRAT